MLTMVAVLAVLAVGVVLVRELPIGLRAYRQGRTARNAVILEQLRAEQQLHQLTQNAVAQMLEAARRSRQ